MHSWFEREEARRAASTASGVTAVFIRVGHAGTYRSNICPDESHAVIAGRAVSCGTREISIRTEE